MTAPPLIRLDWDSRAFGFPVARLDGPDLGEAGLEAALGAAGRDGYHLVYWTTRPDRAVAPGLLERRGGRLVDTKVTYRRDELDLPGPPAALAPDLIIAEVPPGPASPALRDLGIAAGLYSRFHVDPRFPDRLFRALYETWIERCCRRELAATVLAAVPAAGGDPVGVVTVAVEGGEGQIGLIAVSEAARGRGVGSALMEAAHDAMRARRARRAAVVTQQSNRAACRLYERHGYRLGDCSHYYHFWTAERPNP